jgi:hypothetical protein
MDRSLWVQKVPGISLHRICGILSVVGFDGMHEKL